MVSGAEAQIAEALLWYVAQTAANLGLPVSMPNVAYLEQNATPYLAATVMPNMADAVGIEFGSDINHQGLLQVSIFWPAGAGEIKPMQVASQIVAAFRRGAVISRNGLRVMFEQQPQVASPLSQADWFQVPVTARWRALAPDPAAP